MDKVANFLNVDITHRKKHGALKDAIILSHIFMKMIDKGITSL